MNNRDATNPEYEEWFSNPVKVVDTIKTKEIESDLIKITFGISIGEKIAPVVTIYATREDAAAFGGSLLSLGD